MMDVGLVCTQLQSDNVSLRRTGSDFGMTPICFVFESRPLFACGDIAEKRRRWAFSSFCIICKYNDVRL